MIRNALSFLKDQVNDYMRVRTGTTSSDERVVLSNIVDVDQNDSMGLPENKIVLSLICIEEERIFKSQENYIKNPGERPQLVNPELKLNLYVLFAAHFNNSNYDEALKFLSLTLAYFQANTVFDSSTHPALDPTIRRIVMELYTQPMDQQSQLWQALGGKFLPSVMYKLRLLTINEELSKHEVPEVIEIDQN